MPDNKTASSKSITPADLLTDFSPQVRQVAEALRMLVKRTAPEASEKAYPG